MEVRCDKCQARYRVDDARVGPQGLTMRCGKCQNIFKVTRSAEAQAPAAPPAAPPPLPKAAHPKVPEGNATMMFVATPAAKPAQPAAPVAPAPVAPDEGAGRTMMFQTGNLKSAPKAAAAAPKASGGTAPLKPATAPPPNPTMLFGQAPAGAKLPAAPAKPAAKRTDEVAGSTMMFGQAPAARPPSGATPPPPESPAVPEIEEPLPPPEGGAGASDEVPAEADAPDGAGPDDGTRDEAASTPGGRFDQAPPKGLLIGVGVGLLVLLLAAAALLASKKLGKRPPPQIALEALASAQATADKDSLPAIADAEAKIKEAVEAAGPKVRWPQAQAALALVEIQWADALNDTAALLTTRAERAGDDARKAEAETRAQKAQDDAKAKLKGAFEIAAPALKIEPKSSDLQLALADYYRAQKSNANMNRELRKAQALRADEARIQFIQGAQLAQEEDGAERAVPKLKAAVAAQPGSARLHFRLAMAYLTMKDEAAALKELQETLRLSPEHERARLALEQASAAGRK